MPKIDRTSVPTPEGDRAAAADFASYLVERIAASDAYVDGDAGPLATVSSHRDPATIFPPNGRCVSGAADVDAFNAGGAALFEPGSRNAVEVLHCGVSGDLAYLVGRQVCDARMVGQPEPVSMALRITELFRREQGRWLLFHRHADAAA